MRYDLWKLTNETIEFGAVTAAVDYVSSDNMMEFFLHQCLDAFFALCSVDVI